MLSIKSLHKSFGTLQALKGINLQIKEGELYGLLGPNGAGKTTFINILSTLIKPDNGEVLLDGLNPVTQREECKKIIGVVPQEIALYDDLSALDNLMFWGGLYNIKPIFLKEKINSTLELLGLYNRKNEKIKTFSGGMKRRINIATALLHLPKILFLDEPTVGIDPQSRNLIYEVIKKLNKEGMTIIYTTHYLKEAENLCERISILDRGAIIIEGTLDELRKSTSAEDTITIRLSEPPEQDIINSLRACYNFPISITNSIIIFTVPNASKELASIISKMSETGLDIIQIEINKSNLESIFLKLTGMELRD
ncbi:MAG: hypothetical protein A3G23_05770 [Bacteroidetes bacterium RIFCSPLOWO2_12_FULL_37_12]|nr:MAG: hypothetical protein A3G23_05770 [Bacteroidetes bacterium RIFCSPLOWO2_12_FULL_37_12]